MVLCNSTAFCCYLLTHCREPCQRTNAIGIFESAKQQVVDAKLAVEDAAREQVVQEGTANANANANANVAPGAKKKKKKKRQEVEREL